MPPLTVNISSRTSGTIFSFTAATTILTAFLCGCETTPSNPPVTPVVEPVFRRTAVMTRGAAATRMITALTTRRAALANAPAPPGVGRDFDSPSPETAAMADDVWRSLIRMRMLVPDSSNPTYRLRSEFKRAGGSSPTEGGHWVWTMTLSNPNEPAWSESLLIDGN